MNRRLGESGSFGSKTKTFVITSLFYYIVGQTKFLSWLNDALGNHVTIKDVLENACNLVCNASQTEQLGA